MPPSQNGGEEEDLVSKVCLGLTLLSPHTTKLASKEDETPDTAVEHTSSQECVHPESLQNGA